MEQTQVLIGATVSISWESSLCPNPLVNTQMEVSRSRPPIELVLTHSFITDVASDGAKAIRYIQYVRRGIVDF